MYCNIITNRTDAEVCTFWLDSLRQPVDISIGGFSPYINFEGDDYNVLPDMDSFTKGLSIELRGKLLKNHIINSDFENDAALFAHCFRNGVLYVLIDHKFFYYELYRISQDYSIAIKEKQFILHDYGNGKVSCY